MHERPAGTERVLAWMAWATQTFTVGQSHRFPPRVAQGEVNQCRDVGVGGGLIVAVAWDSRSISLGVTAPRF